MYLNCHSWFSLKYGTLSPEDLVKEAKEKGMATLVLTDIHNTSAASEFYAACLRSGIKPVVGIEFRIGDNLLYTGIAKNNEGFRELNVFLSRHNASQKALPEQAPPFEQVYVIYPWGSKATHDLLPHEYTGIRLNELTRLATSADRHDRSKMVMMQPVTFRNKQGFNTHRLLRAIDTNCLLSQLTPAQQCADDEYLLPLETYLQRYEDFPELIANTAHILDTCSIAFDGRSKNKKLFTQSAGEDRALLERLALEGMAQRFGTNNEPARARVMKELQIIHDLGFNAYFLITWDMICYAASREFSYVGRGSGANSIVAYCLRITDVDPMKLDLYFERFLNPHRSSPPDFDIDFAHNERTEIIAYLFRKYGTAYTVLLATYNSFKSKSAVRELAKVFGLPKEEIDAITRNPDKLRKRDAGFDNILRLIFRYAGILNGIPSHLSIHAGGILISEEPIYQYTATDLPPKGFPITHFDMFAAEELGLHKYDVLGQRGLGHIRDTIKLVKKNRGETVTLDFEKAKDDPLVQDHLYRADTVGCFYIESPGMRMLLRKLRCRDYITLVAASSIIRPGVAQAGMMSEYIRRFHHPESFQYLHPKMEELLKETYGVMVYQEDVIKVAHHFAGLDLATSDTLRRAMSGKYKGTRGFDIVKDTFFASCKEKGYNLAVVTEVWRQIESFGGFSFSKAHSASFAVESYHSLYLKVHYPLEFIVAVLNNEGGFYQREFYLHEARMCGASIEAPCVNSGAYYDTISGSTVYTGFRYIKELEVRIGEVIEAERKANGMYRDLYDFVKRVPVSHQQLMLLIRIGAFRFTGKTKKVLLLDAWMLFSKSKAHTRGPELFEPEIKELSLPALKSFSYEDAYDQIELLEFPLCFPYDLLPQEHAGTITTDQMLQHLGKQVIMTGYFVTLKYLYTNKSELMAFAHFFDAKGKGIDSIHFPPSLKRYPFKGGGFYKMRGKITQEFDYPTLEVESMYKIPFVKKELI